MLQKLSAVFMFFVAFTGYWFGSQCVSNDKLASYLLARHDHVVDVFFLSCQFLTVMTVGSLYLLFAAPDFEARIWKSRFESGMVLCLSLCGLVAAVAWEYTGWELDVFAYVAAGWGFKYLVLIGIGTLAAATLYWGLLFAKNMARRG